MFTNFSSNLPTEIHFCESSPSLNKYLLFILLIRACVANEILKWVGCVRWGAVLGIVGGGVTFRFLNGDAIPDKNMPFWFS